MFKLSIVTPEKPFYEGECRSLVVPGAEGYLGVLTDHAPLITALQPGELKLTDDRDQERHFAISGGFFEVSHNHATVLADAVEEPGMIDLVESFLENLPGMYQQIRQAEDDEDWQSLSAQVHDLKSIGGGYGYPQLTEISQRIETALAKTNYLEASGLLNELETLCQRIVEGGSSQEKDIHQQSA